MTSLVTRTVPDFTAPAVLASGEIVENFNLSNAIKDKYALIFFYPLDFTFVCPTELVALDKRIAAFKKMGVEVIGVSIDSHFTHNAWRNTPRDKGGIGPLNFTLVADINHTICQSFGIEHPEAGVALRAGFMIDKAGTVQVQHTNNLPLGRNIDEFLRLFTALQFHEEHGEVCPAGWQEGKNGMTASPAGVADFLANNEDQLGAV